MMRTVVREHHWTPEVLNNLYLDNQDHHGLQFWYEDVLEVIKDIKEKK